MYKFTPLLMALALVAAVMYGCDEPRPTQPAEVTTDADPDLTDLQGILASTFDSDTDGWTLVGDAVDALGLHATFRLHPEHRPSMGNPGGAVCAVDEGRGMPWFFQAPPKFLGNRFFVYGGRLEFDLKVLGSGRIFNTADVIMAGADLTLVAPVAPDPGFEWTRYSVVLKDAGGWRVGNVFDGRYATNAEIRRVLSDLTVLRIRGEHLDDIGDVSCLDNVRMRVRGLRR